MRSLFVLCVLAVWGGCLSANIADNKIDFDEKDDMELEDDDNSIGTGMEDYTDIDIDEDYISPIKNLTGIVQFYLYTKKNYKARNAQELIYGDVNSIKNSYFDPAKPTYFVIHGYLNNLYFPAIQAPKKALLKWHDCNVIGVDWGSIAFSLLYPKVASETRHVGQHVALMARFLVKNAGLDLGKTHIIGHSLGAHVSGFAGKNLKGLARITGLDPAGPGFTRAKPADRLDSTDAKFVDCIYTNAGKLGIKHDICQSNFFPNGGSKQPGCFIDLTGTCSHLRVINLFAESVDSNNHFVASQCSDVPKKDQACARSSNLMGYHTTNSQKGIFYVKTNSKSPYWQL